VSSRFLAVEQTAQRHGEYPTIEKNGGAVSDKFGIQVFNRSVMRKMLPQNILKNILNAMDGKEKIKEEFGDSIAVAMKEWAIVKERRTTRIGFIL
jgi:glutamine synthetase